MGHQRHRVLQEHGQATITLVVVVISVAIATGLLYRTSSLASSINAKAERILETGRGINTATDSVLQLNETNRLAASILKTAKPLEGKLDRVVALANSISGLAGSINSTAGTVDATARGINAEAADILATARNIERNVATINARLVVTLGDARDIVGNLKTTHHFAARIDCALGGTGCDGH